MLYNSNDDDDEETGCHSRPTLALKVWCWYVKATSDYKISCGTVCMQSFLREIVFFTNSRKFSTLKLSHYTVVSKS